MAKRRGTNKRGRGRPYSFRHLSTSVEHIPVSSEEFFKNKQKKFEHVVINDDTLYDQAIDLHLQAVQLEKEIDCCREVHFMHLFQYLL